MNEKMYTVKNFAKLTGVTERTLHYYDRKGVLTPTSYTKNGHRLYSNEDIFKMQKILTLKYLGFSLKEIIEHLSKNSTNSLHDTLYKQKELLKKKRDEIDYIIGTISRVEQIIQAEKVESDLLLLIIHSIQNEKNQKQWLSTQLSEPIVEQAFMQHMPKEEKLKTERDLFTIINKLQVFYENGASPHTFEVQRLITQLDKILSKIIEPKYQKEVEKLEIEESSLYNISFMSKGFQDYIGEAARILNEENNM
ncbi:MerR family transcriptional regulator [Solibacillus cecembensis]|uniref:MerR family transcriptional regulator n=1 Tax=Solibacillus cecembensis TaxID=459347 RepID=UPI003D0187A9